MTHAQLVSIYERFLREDSKSLSDCYKKSSELKQRAYENCLNDAYRHHGYDGSVVSYNSFMFTFAYTYRVETSDGINRHFVYITPDHRYDIEVGHR